MGFTWVACSSAPDCIIFCMIKIYYLIPVSENERVHIRCAYVLYHYILCLLTLLVVDHSLHNQLIPKDIIRIEGSPSFYMYASHKALWMNSFWEQHTWLKGSLSWACRTTNICSYIHRINVFSLLPSQVHDGSEPFTSLFQYMDGF